MQLRWRSTKVTLMLRAAHLLPNDQIRSVTASAFAEKKPLSRCYRHPCSPTGEVFDALRKEGFQPSMVMISRTLMPQ